MKKGVSCFIIGMFLVSSIVIIVTPLITSSDIPIPYPLDSADEYTTTGEWDSGFHNNTTTSTNRYNISAGDLEIDFPYADKDGNLQSYWRFENDLIDETGNHNGVSTIADYTPSGKFGGAYDYELTNSDFTQLGQDLFETDNAGTVSAWIKPESITTADHIFSSSILAGASLLGIAIYDDGANDVLYFQWYQTIVGAGNDVLYGNIPISTGNWNHVALTTDGSTWKVYINGVEDTPLNVLAGGNSGKWFNDFKAGTHEVRLGRRQYTGGDNYFDGIIDEVKIYDRTLTLSDIQYLNNSGNQYKDEGNWTTPLITPVGSEILNNITIDLNNSWAGNCIDKIEILNATDEIISTDTTDLTTNGTIVRTDTTFDNGFNGTTENGSFKIKIFLKCPNTDTPILQRLNYTTITAGDSTPPEITNMTDTPDPQDFGSSVNITANITDNVALDNIYINITYPNSTYLNTSMVQGSGNYWHYETAGLNTLGLHNYTIAVNDTSNNWAYTSGTFLIVDVTPPEKSNLTMDGFPVTVYYLNQSGSVAINITVTDQPPGNSYIGGANITGVHLWNFTAIDGAFDETEENCTTTVNGTEFVVPATYFLTVNAWDNVSNYNTTGMICYIIWDNNPPDITNVLVNGNSIITVIAGVTVNLTTTISDIGSGLVEGANWTDGINNWPGTSIIPSDGSFDAPIENGYSLINTTGWTTGTHYIYVSAWDQADLPNYNSSGSFATINIVDNFQSRLSINIDFEYKQIDNKVAFNYTGKYKAIREYRWNFGDGYGSFGERDNAVVHSYPTDDGEFIVKLEILTQDGRIFSTSQLIILESDFIELDFENGEMRLGSLTYWIPFLTITGSIGIAISLWNPKWLDEGKYWNTEIQALFSTLAFLIGFFFLAIQYDIIRNPFIPI